MGLREFLRGGYHNISERTIITDRSRPVAVWIPPTDRVVWSSLFTPLPDPAIDDENDVISSDTPSGGPDRRGAG